MPPYRVVKIAKRVPQLTEALRQDTRDAHNRLHEHPVTGRLTTADLTKPQYIQVLEAFYGFYAPRQNQLDENAHRAAWLTQDLHYFRRAIETIPRCANLPSLSNSAQRLGYLYVVEGSMLGAQIIARRLTNSLSVTPTTGGRYFFAYGDQGSARWRNLKRILDAQSTHQHTDIIASAQDTFAALEQWLNQIIQDSEG